MRRIRLIVVAAVLGLLLSSCSGSEEEPSIVGVWVHDFGDGFGVVEFRDSGTFILSLGEDRGSVEEFVTADYTMEDGTLTYGPGAVCSSAGTYSVTFEGDHFTQTLVTDLCTQRAEGMNGLVWRREAASTEPGDAVGGSSAAGDPVSGSVPWWNQDVFYEVFVRSFQDSDSDGTGDLQGLIDRLDYLNDGDPDTDSDLGVTGLWLMPITESPSYHGYDATDYFTVEADYGTNKDFKALVAAAHERGIRVIVDLMLNHTSSEHPWFVDSASGPGSAKRDWYVWRDDNPGQTSSWGTSAWHPLNGAYYLGLFWEGMPDLNFRTQAVTDQMYAVADFWLRDLGADGFRLDAVRHLIEEGEDFDGGPATHAWLAAWDDHIDSVDPQALTVGEIWDEQADTTAAYVRDGEVDVAFAFTVAEALLGSVRSGDPAAFDAALADALATFPPGQFAPFLTNHDQNRVMSELDGDVAAAKLAASALLTLPGVPFVYYGEEIGMTGQKPDERIRTPMQWTADGSGFSPASPWEPANGDAATVNVAAQQADPDSLLSHYRRLIGLRNDLDALRTGGLQALASTCPAVYAFLRPAADVGQGSALVVLNFADTPQAGCRLSTGASDLAGGTHDAIDLLRGRPGPQLEVGADGSIEAYVPVDSVAARGVAVLRLDAAPAEGP